MLLVVEWSCFLVLHVWFHTRSHLSPLLGFLQELRKGLRLSTSLQTQEDCSSDEYDSIEEDVLSETETEDSVQPVSNRDECPLPSHDAVLKDVPKDQELEGRHPQTTDTLVVMEFNPASKGELFMSFLGLECLSI